MHITHTKGKKRQNGVTFELKDVEINTLLSMSIEEFTAKTTPQV